MQVMELSNHDRLELFFALLLAIDFIYGLRTGSTILFFRRYKRGIDPFNYWFSIAFSGMLSVALVFIVFRSASSTP